MNPDTVRKYAARRDGVCGGRRASCWAHERGTVRARFDGMTVRRAERPKPNRPTLTATRRENSVAVLLARPDNLDAMLR
jgi:hypothetical protein